MDNEDKVVWCITLVLATLVVGCIVSSYFSYQLESRKVAALERAVDKGVKIDVGKFFDGEE